MSSSFVKALLGLLRQAGMFERDAICCGTVTVQQCVALQLLLEAPRDNGELAELTGVAASSATRLVDGLQRRGFVERTPDPADRRHILIELTKAGVEEAKRLEALTEARIGEVLRAIPKKKHAQVLESVQLIAGALERRE